MTFALLTDKQKELFLGYLVGAKLHVRYTEEFVQGDKEPLEDRLIRMASQGKRTLEIVEAIKQEGTLVEEKKKKAKVARFAEEVATRTKEAEKWITTARIDLARMEIATMSKQLEELQKAFKED